MRRAPDGTVTQLATATALRNPDLGRDAQNRLVLAYARCSTLSKCTYVRDDLAGTATAFKLAPKNCAISSTPAVWGRRVAFGAACFKRVKGKRVSDAARSGLYVRKGSAKPRRLPTPRDARRTGSDSVIATDLRGTNVAAVFTDIASFAVLRGVAAKSPARTIRVGSSEGDTDQRVIGLALPSATTMFTLTDSNYGGEPAQSIINRMTANCSDYQVLTAPAGPRAEFESPITDIAADGATVYVVTPGVGITTHEYKPDVGC
jgi:hypothetical protein